MTIIRVVDLETCGLTPAEGGVCEIGFCDVQDTDHPTQWKVDTGLSVLVNPGQPIPPQASAVHHIIDEDVADANPWELASLGILNAAFREGEEIVAFAAHNAKFDRQWISEDLTGKRPWIDTYKCALRLYPDAPSHGNQALRYFLKPHGINRNEAAPHRAYGDAYVTAFLLRDMLELASVPDLISWSARPALQTRCHFGKWRGTPWKDVDAGFLKWILSKPDFDEDVVFTVQTELERRAAAARAG